MMESMGEYVSQDIKSAMQTRCDALRAVVVTLALKEEVVAGRPSGSASGLALEHASALLTKLARAHGKATESATTMKKKGVEDDMKLDERMKEIEPMIAEFGSEYMTKVEEEARPELVQLGGRWQTVMRPQRLGRTSCRWHAHWMRLQLLPKSA